MVEVINCTAQTEKKNRKDTNNYQGSRKISRDKGFEV